MAPKDVKQTEPQRPDLAKVIKDASTTRLKPKEWVPQPDPGLKPTRGRGE